MGSQLESFLQGAKHTISCTDMCVRKLCVRRAKGEKRDPLIHLVAGWAEEIVHSCIKQKKRNERMENAFLARLAQHRAIC
jgi:hypothetical protein